MSETSVISLRLAVAALCGLAVGSEREWSGHASGPHGRFAGIRTFFLLGALGGLAGWLAESDRVALAVTLLAGAMALIVAAYYAAARPGGQSVEGTTEVAALVVVALGILAGFGFLQIAAGSTAIMVLALSEKDRLRKSITSVSEEEMRAALQFAVLALVILPILPDTAYGPLGTVRLRSLWIVVLIFTAINFAAYIAGKVAGRERGYAITGLLGGGISSTAVTLTFSRRSRDEPAAGAGLALGVIGACTVLLVRLLVLGLALNYEVARALVPFIAIPFLVGAAMVAVGWARGQASGTDARPGEHETPLHLWSAMKMAVAFQVSLTLLALVRERLGFAGVMASATVLGLTDMDALTLSMNRLGTTSDLVQIAARAIVVGVIANSVLKLGLVLVFGRGRYRVLAGAGMALLTVVTGASLVMLW